MEPVITTIATAIALGAAAGLKDTAAQAVKDSWAGLKKLIQDRYQRNEDVTAAIDHVSRKPEATARRQMLEQALQNAGADKDAEVIKAAEALLAAVKKQPGGEEAVRQIVNQQVTGNGNIFSGTGNVSVTR
jgi:hypothetical protein